MTVKLMSKIHDWIYKAVFFVIMIPIVTNTVGNLIKETNKTELTKAGRKTGWLFYFLLGVLAGFLLFLAVTGI